MTVFVKITVCTADFERGRMCESQFLIWTCLNFYITSVSKMLTLSLLWSVVFLLCLLLFSSFFLRFPFNSVTSVFSFIFYDFVVAYSFFIVLVILLFASFEWGSFVFFWGISIFVCVCVSEDSSSIPYFPVHVRSWWRWPCMSVSLSCNHVDSSSEQSLYNVYKDIYVCI